jgi:tetratricopeptide (TPR) repeat protein
MPRVCFIVLLLACVSAVFLCAQEAPEAPLGLILSAKGVGLHRADSETALNAKPGDVLFAGDSLRSESGEATFVYCSDQTSQKLAGTGEVVFQARQLRVLAGALTEKKNTGGCFLPSMPRHTPAAEEHAGAELSRQFSGADAGSFESRVEQLAASQHSDLNAELHNIDAAMATDPNNPVNHLQRAALLDRFNLKADAALEMRKVAEQWPDAAWTRSRLFVLEEEAAKNRIASGPSAPQREGQTFAVLVGISEFKDQDIPQLKFAHMDAAELARLLQTPRAGAIPPENIVLLTNQSATKSAILSGIETQLRGRAGRNDTILFFIASHGTVMDVNGKSKGFVVAHDSNVQDLATTGIAMETLRSWFEQEAGNVRRLYLYLDVCRAGKLGQVAAAPKSINSAAARTADEDNVFGILAAQQGQVAIESVNYGGGHGAFSYFLLRALNGDADLNNDGNVTMNELADYVKEKVDESTNSRQIPKAIGDVDEKQVMAHSKMPGIELGAYTGATQVAITAARGLGPAGSDDVQPQLLRSVRLKYESVADLLDQFDTAIQNGEILPDQNAFTVLRALRARMQEKDYVLQAEKLRTALEDKGQEVLLRYLAGDQIPQTRADFLAGQSYYEAAALLARDSVFLEARRDFCEGRVAIFDKNYPAAIALLERAVRLDPERAYGYNALGIAYLERANYDRAASAFRDAARRAPFWAYPLHNLALALAERGDFDGAVRTYQRAIQLAPKYAYLRYNLGLVYQRTNRLGEAADAYKQTLALAPQDARTLNALGSLKAAQGKSAEAERFYRYSLQQQPELLQARHNLAVLLWERPSRSAEAIALWRENLSRAPDFLPSRLSLARHLAETDKTGAAAEYIELLRARPDYVAARVALADLDAELGKTDDALAQIRQAIAREQENPDLYEKMGDLARTGRLPAEARDAYEKALQLVTQKADRKRITRKMESVKP